MNVYTHETDTLTVVVVEPGEAQELEPWAKPLCIAAKQEWDGTWTAIVGERIYIDPIVDEVDTTFWMERRCIATGVMNEASLVTLLLRCQQEILVKCGSCGLWRRVAAGTRIECGSCIPEEGGWYFQSGIPVESRHYSSREDMEKGMAELRTKYTAMNEGRRPISSVLSEGIYEVRLEGDFAKPWPTTRPHYE